ncbi:MAG: anhydro-N-acetylmuramic acid kinase [Alphaproteobacteria bacterium]
MRAKTVLALGLMSGTSLDGIDAALVETDGEAVAATGAAITVPYDPALRERLRCILGSRGPSAEVAAVEAALTDAHADAVRALLRAAGVAPERVAVAGFHGHTILHDPAGRRTWQIGDAARLAAATGIDIVHDFRTADVAAGGEGAPLAPAFHAALARMLPGPLAVLNLGGVGNLTWISGAAPLLAFDTGPGNALIDDWVKRCTGAICDMDGRLAARGRVQESILSMLLGHPYFERIPPKSLDRDAFDPSPVHALPVEDGAATLAAFTAAAVERAVAHLPAPPLRWLVTGGGRHNPTLLAMLRTRLGVAVEPVEAVGWDGDALEAQAFAFLAVRSLRGLPLSYPGTTGVPQPQPGGRLTRRAAAA